MVNKDLSWCRSVAFSACLAAVVFAQKSCEISKFFLTKSRNPAIFEPEWTDSEWGRDHGLRSRTSPKIVPEKAFRCYHGGLIE